jgi:hypothetical protein
LELLETFQTVSQRRVLGNPPGERAASGELRRIVTGLVLQRVPELEAPREARDGHETATDEPKGARR